MAIWVIGDPHLSFSVDKPMDIFGPAWNQHAERLQKNWIQVVSADDTVILAGDISWAMQPEDAIADLAFLNELPGKRKILLRGNHDYWWSTRSRVERLLAENRFDTLEIFQNESLVLEAECGEVLLVGTRGWNNPLDEDFSEDDRKVFAREVQRLGLSLAQGRKLLQAHDFVHRLAVMHYPPVTRSGQSSRFSDMLEEFGVDVCCYGHLHGYSVHVGFSGEHGGVRYEKVSADFLEFWPKKIFD